MGKHRNGTEVDENENEPDEDESPSHHNKTEVPPSGGNNNNNNHDSGQHKIGGGGAQVPTSTGGSILISLVLLGLFLLCFLLHFRRLRAFLGRYMPCLRPAPRDPLQANKDELMDTGFGEKHQIEAPTGTPALTHANVTRPPASATPSSSSNAPTAATSGISGTTAGTIAGTTRAMASTDAGAATTSSTTYLKPDDPVASITIPLYNAHAPPTNPTHFILQLINVSPFRAPIKPLPLLPLRRTNA
ncbi:hypothetical protein BC940DRAFT_287528 [Gongronella butleri]|nr:hypothetical protein BC940DRAFT_287528 [Gongronella butleri]